MLNDIKNSDWILKASNQVGFTLRKQVLRRYVYPYKMQLTLPPEKLWKITLISQPFRKIIQGYEYIVRNYNFYSVVLGRADSKIRTSINKNWCNVSRSLDTTH